MLRLTAAVSALALACIAGAAELNDVRFDASSARAFESSLQIAKQELSPANLRMLGGALKHIWNEGSKTAEGAGRRYTDGDYYRQIDGLSYDEIVHFTDATYAAALAENREATNEAEVVAAAAESEPPVVAAECPCADAIPAVSTLGRRSLRRIDASSETAFKESVALFQHKLSRSRRHAFERALQDIWTEGTKKASAEQRDYTASDYFAQLDGLSYDEVVRISDPTGAQEKVYRAEYYRATPGGMSFAPVRSGTQGQRWGGGFNTENVPRGGTDLYGVPGQNQR